jgi:hypothetical protein
MIAAEAADPAGRHKEIGLAYILLRAELLPPHLVAVIVEVAARSAPKQAPGTARTNRPK